MCLFSRKAHFAYIIILKAVCRVEQRLLFEVSFISGNYLIESKP